MVRASVCQVVIFSSLALAVLMGRDGMASLAQAQDDDQTLKERFLREAPARWAEYAELAKQVQGTYSFRGSLSPVGVKVENRSTLKMNRNCKLIEDSAERKVPGGKGDYQTLTLYALNPHYAFKLRRKNPTSPWYVTEVVDLRTDSLPPEIQHEFQVFERCVLELVSLGPDPLVELLGKPEFRVVRCRRVLQDGEELVAVDFDYPHTADAQDSGIQGGTLVLDPRRFWCLRSYEVQFRSISAQGTRTYRVLELEEAKGGFPLPKRTTELIDILMNDGTKRKNESWRDCNLHIPSRLSSDEEFTLSAFGFPEPLGVSWSRPTRWYLWLSLAGVLCLAGGGVFYWLKRRAAT